MTRIFHWFFIWKMDPMSGCDNPTLVFTLEPKDSTLQYKKCVHLWNNFDALLPWINLSSLIKSKNLNSLFWFICVKIDNTRLYDRILCFQQFSLVSNFLACQTKYLTFFYFLTSNSVRSYFNSEEGNLTEKEKKEKEGK